MAKKPIRPLRNEADYESALDEVEKYFEKEPKPGTPEADRFDLPALVIEDYERNVGRSIRRTRSTQFVTGWRLEALRKPTSAAFSVRGSGHPIFLPANGA